MVCPSSHVHVFAAVVVRSSETVGRGIALGCQPVFGPCNVATTLLYQGSNVLGASDRVRVSQRRSLERVH